MGASWFVKPETCRLPLSEEQWLLVKRRLTAGEFRAHLRRSSRVGDDAIRRIDNIDHSLSLVVAYLLDWSLDATIRGASEQDLIATLDSLDPSRFAEIKQAIETHEAAMDAEREQKKTTTDGGTKSDPISPSPSGPGSPSTLSETLM